MLFAITGQAAHAADCKPLQILNTIKMEANKDGTRYLVPVTVNDKPQKFLLDTGGGISQISRAAAKSLGMKEEASRWQLFDMYGNDSDTKVTAKTFVMGIQGGKDVILQVSPSAQMTDDGLDGILARDLFLQYDVDFDFGASRLNYFSQDHCEGKVAYWAERPLAIIPFTDRSSHINFPVLVDGHQMLAMIDTGSTDTLMSAT